MDEVRAPSKSNGLRPMSSVAEPSPSSSVVTVMVPYGCVRRYMVSGRPSSTRKRTLPKTIC